MLALVAAAACSQAGHAVTGTGGTGAGGAVETGGGWGGAGIDGRDSGAGGSASTGGATSAGGSRASGGTTSLGGAISSGGMTTSSSAVGTGGAKAAGGSSGTGVADDAADSPDARATRDADAATDISPLDAQDAAGMDVPGKDATVTVLDGSVCPAPGAGTFSTSSTHRDIGVHDPSMMSDGKRFYLFGTGGILSIRSSANGLDWSNAGQVFPSVPAWVTTTLGVSASGFDLWAPDISFFACKYHVYYAGSTFGSNISVIGLATSAALDPGSASWADEGMVIQSKSSDNYNAIDPNVSFDDTGTPWLAFGSFWDGIKMRKLDPATGKPSTTDTTLYSLASRKGTGDAIEAASIVSHNGYYYLFVSFDACCKGTSSTYRTMVGRGNTITGPYTDKAGTSMAKGAAEQLLASSGRYIGPGGGTAFRNGDSYYYAFHYYDGDDNGNSKLQIRPVDFGSDDWPTLGDPLFP